MLKLHAVQALHGDCFLLEFGTPRQPRYLLVDGGPDNVYDAYLRPALAKVVGPGGRLDCVVLSHADDDHVIGLVDFFAELVNQQQQGERPFLDIGGVWINSFDLDGAPVPISVFAPAQMVEIDTERVTLAQYGVAEGMDVRNMADRLGIPRNDGFRRNEVELDTAPGPIRLGNLTMHVVGPTKANLERLRREWKEWLRARAEAVAPAAAPDVREKVRLDQSVPNRGSIMLLVEGDGKRILLTGDGRSDHLVKGLEQAGLMAKGGTFHVDVLKVPHHGSARNTTRKFFHQVTADVYLFSANGRHDNPDLATLIWLVEAVHEQGRKVKLVMTNATPSVDQLKENYPPAEYGYTISIMRKNANVLSLRVA
jgi:hypothetical protein